MDRIVTARKHDGQVFDVVTRSSQRITVEPGASGPEAAGPGPMELMLVSLATCAGSTIDEVLTKMRFPARDVRVVVEGRRASSVPRVWTDLHMTYLVRADAGEDRLLRALHVTERTCSAYAMISKVAAVTSAIYGVIGVPADRTIPVRQRVLRPGRSVAETVLDGEETMTFFGAVRPGGEVVGSVGVCQEESPDRPGVAAWRVRAMATDEEVRGLGLGRMLVDAAVDHARDAGGGLVWANVRVGARGFYEAAGFQAVSDVFDIAGIGPHVRMELAG